jgi:Beta2-adaptin appendage, C-terminal sub-domain
LTSLENSPYTLIFTADLPTVDIEKIKSKLAGCDVSFVAKRDVPGADGQPQSAVYFSCTTIPNNSFLVELKFKSGMNLCKVTVKSSNKVLSELCKVTIAKVLMIA